MAFIGLLGKVGGGHVWQLLFPRHHCWAMSVRAAQVPGGSHFNQFSSNEPAIDGTRGEASSGSETGDNRLRVAEPF
jgi:hypothetical protein